MIKKFRLAIKPRIKICCKNHSKEASFCRICNTDLEENTIVEVEIDEKKLVNYLIKNNYIDAYNVNSNFYLKNKKELILFDNDIILLEELHTNIK